jgi:hypothetical protein
MGDVLTKAVMTDDSDLKLVFLDFLNSIHRKKLLSNAGVCRKKDRAVSGLHMTDLIHMPRSTPNRTKK